MEDIDKIHFMRSGGFAGFNLSTTINLNELKPEEASALKKMINESGIKNIESPSAKVGNDLFTYNITFESVQESKTVTIDQKDVSPSTEPLINFLTNKAKTRR